MRRAYRVVNIYSLRLAIIPDHEFKTNFAVTKGNLSKAPDIEEGSVITGLSFQSELGHPICFLGVFSQAPSLLRTIDKGSSLKVEFLDRITHAPPNVGGTFRETVGSVVDSASGNNDLTELRGARLRTSLSYLDLAPREVDDSAGKKKFEVSINPYLFWLFKQLGSVLCFICSYLCRLYFCIGAAKMSSGVTTRQQEYLISAGCIGLVLLFVLCIHTAVYLTL